MNRLEKLKKLEKDLDELMRKANSRVFSSLARQYRETRREIEEIEGTENIDDEIEEIMQNRRDNGDAGAVRKNSS